MPESGRAIAVPARADPRRGWLVVSLQVGGLITFDASLTLFDESRISDRLANFLRPFGLLTGVSGRHLLRELALGSVPIADLEVGVAAGITRAAVDGILGRDFLRGTPRSFSNRCPFD